MQKAASMASTLVLYFLPNCANFWAVGGKLVFFVMLTCTACASVLILEHFLRFLKHC